MTTSLQELHEYYLAWWFLTKIYILDLNHLIKAILVLFEN